jgi:uncharacterized protein YkwD
MQYARRALLLLIVLCMGECVIPSLCSQSEFEEQVAEQFTVEKQFESRMLEQTNHYRIQNGLQTLGIDDALTEIAREHSREMAWMGFISHDLPSGNVSVRMIRAGYSHDMARENVARSGSLSWAYNALLQSPSHHENIVAADITKIGIGIVRAPGSCNRMLYITEIFANPRPARMPRQISRAQTDNSRQNSSESPVSAVLAATSVSFSPGSKK